MITALDYKSKYGTIDSSKREIRLLTISSVNDDEAACDIETVSLHDEPRYNALSYVWGSPTDSATLYLGAHGLPVGKNLNEALLQLVSIGRWGKFWVDALCINQADEDEKAQQVGLMGEIYSKAFQTIAWLGPVQDDSDKVVKSITRLSEWVKENKFSENEKLESLRDEAGRASLESLIDALDYGDEADHQVALKPIAKLFDSPWWHRLWKFQELILAKKIVIVCGPQAVSWGHCVRASLGLRYLAMRAPSHQHRVTLSETVNALWYSTEMWAARHAIENVNTLSLLNLLEVSAFRGRKASDPRDHVFGLLGVAQDQVAKDIRVDYQKSALQLFTEVAAKMISRYGLSTLSYCRPRLSRRAMNPIEIDQLFILPYLSVKKLLMVHTNTHRGYLYGIDFYPSPSINPSASHLLVSNSTPQRNSKHKLHNAVHRILAPSNAKVSSWTR